MASVINQIKVGNIEYAIAASAYAECSTAGNVAAKVATICTDSDTTNTAFTLVKGVAVNVKFASTNTAPNPTLNINNTGAKAITSKTSSATSPMLKANTIYTVVYDGTHWIITNTKEEVYVGTGDMPADATLQVILDGESYESTSSSGFLSMETTTVGGTTRERATVLRLADFNSADNNYIYTYLIKLVECAGSRQFDIDIDSLDMATSCISCEFVIDIFPGSTLSLMSGFAVTVSSDLASKGEISQILSNLGTGGINITTSGTGHRIYYQKRLLGTRPLS